MAHSSKLLQRLESHRLAVAENPGGPPVTVRERFAVALHRLIARAHDCFCLGRLERIVAEFRVVTSVFSCVSRAIDHVVATVSSGDVGALRVVRYHDGGDRKLVDRPRSGLGTNRQTCVEQGINLERNSTRLSMKVTEDVGDFPVFFISGGRRYDQRLAEFAACCDDCEVSVQRPAPCTS